MAEVAEVGWCVDFTWWMGVGAVHVLASGSGARGSFTGGGCGSVRVCVTCGGWKYRGAGESAWGGLGGLGLFVRVEDMGWCVFD